MPQGGLVIGAGHVGEDWVGATETVQPPVTYINALRVTSVYSRGLRQTTIYKLASRVTTVYRSILRRT